MDVASLNEFVRFVLGGLSTTILDDVTLNKIIQSVLDSGLATTECQEKFYSVKQTLIYLDTKQAAGNAATGGSGAVVKRRESVGKKLVEVTYDSGTGGVVSSWGNVLDDFLANPKDYLLCVPFPVTSDTTGLVLIGGVNMDSYIANLDDPTTRNGFDINVSQVIDRRPTARERRRACVKFY